MSRYWKFRILFQLFLSFFTYRIFIYGILYLYTKKSGNKRFQISPKGANQIWTGDRGVADLCLTTWLWRQMTPTGIEPVLPPWKGDVLTAWPWSHVFCFCVLCLSHDRYLIYHRLDRLASTFWKFFNIFYFFIWRFFIFRIFPYFLRTKKACMFYFCPHVVRFIIVITNPYVPYRSIWYKIKCVTSESDLTCPCRHPNY